jgi:hypothetical protein
MCVGFRIVISGSIPPAPQQVGQRAASRAFEWRTVNDAPDAGD